jgi:hypothetical protein
MPSSTEDAAARNASTSDAAGLVSADPAGGSAGPDEVISSDVRHRVRHGAQEHWRARRRQRRPRGSSAGRQAAFPAARRPRRDLRHAWRGVGKLLVLVPPDAPSGHRQPKAAASAAVVAPPCRDRRSFPRPGRGPCRRLPVKRFLGRRVSRVHRPSGPASVPLTGTTTQSQPKPSPARSGGPVIGQLRGPGRACPGRLRARPAGFLVPGHRTRAEMPQREK